MASRPPSAGLRHDPETLLPAGAGGAPLLTGKPANPGWPCGGERGVSGGGTRPGPVGTSRYLLPASGGRGRGPRNPTSQPGLRPPHGPVTRPTGPRWKPDVGRDRCPLPPGTARGPGTRGPEPRLPCRTRGARGDASAYGGVTLRQTGRAAHRAALESSARRPRNPAEPGPEIPGLWGPPTGGGWVALTDIVLAPTDSRGSRQSTLPTVSLRPAPTGRRWTPGFRGARGGPAAPLRPCLGHPAREGQCAGAELSTRCEEAP